MKKYIFIPLLFFVLFGTASADVNLIIRDGGTKIFEGGVPLPESESVEMTDSEGAPHSVPAKSVLSLVSAADALSESFSITELKYFPSFGSLYLNCINGKCDDWKYVVDGEYPSEGMDKTELSGSETVYLYYGKPNKLSLSSSSISAAETLTVTAQRYDYENNAWLPRDGATVGLTQPNPSDQWNPLEVKIAITDEEGKATFTDISPGNYDVGVKEDYYFPTTALTVSKTPSSSGSYSGGRSSRKASAAEEPARIKKFDIEKAYSFLSSKQEESGSFGSDLYTDWAAVAFASRPEGSDKLKSYLSTVRSSGTSVSDYERRAMALMALGISPYDANGENYIEKITKSFDGKQFGDPLQYNDDVFALIVLLNAGYGKEEEMIKSGLSFILSKQEENGSWSDSPDMTGAALAAMAPFDTDAKEKAKEYLKKSQKEDGGFGNSSSTAWATEGILSLGEKPEDWKKSGKSPLDYFAESQDTDGSIKNENEKNKIWETSYALASLSGKTWHEILRDFEKPEIKIESPKIVGNALSVKKNPEPKIEQTPAPMMEEIPAASSAPQKEGWFKKILMTIFGIF